jgi:capsular exopolysaccharide synthesis family protein
MFRFSLKRRAKSEPTDDFSGRLITLVNPISPASEAYRTLRTNLLYAVVDKPPKVILITSSGPTEGKSTTCANLGVVMAQAGKNTLIVDCDLRKPVLHKIFGLRNLRGIVNVLVGEYSVKEALQKTSLQNLKVLTVGHVPPNPAEILSSERFAEFIDQLRQEFDHVLLDAPPAELVSDAAILATQSDGTLLVLDAQKTRKGTLRHTVRSLNNVGANVLGTVMNNAQISRTGYYSDYVYK